MIRKIIVAWFLLFTGSNLQAQTTAGDSLLNIIATATQDSVKIDVVNNMPFGFYDPDTLIYYSQKIISIGLSQKNELLMAMGWDKLSFGYYLLQHYDEAIEYGLKALKIAEESNNSVVLATINNQLAINYEFIDPVKCKQYSNKAISYLDNAKPNIFDQVILSNNASILVSAGQPDSALVYAQRAQLATMHFKRYEGDAFINRCFSEIYLMKGENELALVYLQKVLATASKFNSNRIFSGAYQGIGNYFDFLHQKDSAIYYYKLAVNSATKIRSLAAVIAPAKKVYYYYRDNGNKDSALKYSGLLLMATDSVLNMNKITLAHNLSFDEEMRQKDIELQKNLAEEARTHNIQMATLAIGILTAIMFFLLLSRSVMVSHGTITFLGVLMMLVIFEFINLLLHPYLESLTNHSPVLMLLALVAIAAVIVPLHHRLEKWATHRLVEKNKVIRLAKAKKVIGELENKIDT